MTIGVIARVKIAQGRGGEFETAFAVQAAQVRAHEPANQLYRLFRSREDPDAYVVMEVYDDLDALEAHRRSPHILANRPAIAPLVAAPTVVEIYDAV